MPSWHVHYWQAVLLRWVVQQGVVVATGSMEQAYDLQDEAIFRAQLRI